MSLRFFIPVYDGRNESFLNRQTTTEIMEHETEQQEDYPATQRQDVASYEVADPSLQNKVNIMRPATEDESGFRVPSPVVVNPVESMTLSHSLMMPSSSANTMIRYVMTAVAVLLIVAAFLSIVTASQYHFLLACVWMTLLTFYIGFCFFIQETVMNSSSSRRRQIFHPVVHAMGDWIASGIKNFVDDCQSEYAVLMLSNEAAYDHYRHFNSTQAQLDVHAAESSRGRPRTRLFRLVIQPIMNVTFRRRRNFRKKRTMPQEDATACDMEAYTPPNVTAV